MAQPQLTLSLLDGEFAVCRLDPLSPVPAWADLAGFSSVTRTADELSVVCRAVRVPPETQCEKGWRCLKVHGPFAFELTGILNSLTGPLARAQIGIFAISTFDTDYLLVKGEHLGKAIEALTGAGHTVNIE